MNAHVLNCHQSECSTCQWALALKGGPNARLPAGSYVHLLGLTIEAKHDAQFALRFGVLPEDAQN